MGIEVNGHQLPPLLVKLIEDGKWGNKQKLSSDVLNKILARAGLPPVALEPEMYTFGNPAGMKNETYSISKLSPNNPEKRLRLLEIYSEASSKELGHEIEDEGIIDIDKAVFIAANYDEDAICLDYRENPENPCVRAFVSTNELFIDWRVIAPDFETFARELGLVE
jgi:hypothetical protein